MVIRQRSTSKSLVKIVVAAALGMLLSKSRSLPPVAVGPSTVRVYHYTNKAGYQGVLESGHIKPSDIKQGDAFYGSGVYGTQLGPSTPAYTILHNNYDSDGGISGRGKDKMDRADYVFALDLPESFVTFVDTEGSRSVLCLGGGEDVPLGNATYHGSADDIALEVKREFQFQEALSKDPILAKAWQLYDTDVKLVFVYMDEVNYQKKLELKESGTCSQDVPALVSHTFPLIGEIREIGFDRVLVMLTSDWDVPGCSGDWEQCILHGEIDHVNLDLCYKLFQWTNLWKALLSYPLDHRVAPKSLDFLTKLRREVLARDCSTGLESEFIALFASKDDPWMERSLLLEMLGGDQNTYLWDKVSVVRAAGKERVQWCQCLLHGNISQVFSTLDSWTEQNSRVNNFSVRVRTGIR